jgi:4a-hydroxytetrahydrobiopterin dehydratase
MSDTFDTAKIEANLKAHPGWTLGDDGQLHREYTFASFTAAFLFAGAVGHLAEAVNHHPDILIHGYKNVRLSMMSHDVNGITARDFKLIALIDDLPQRS